MSRPSAPPGADRGSLYDDIIGTIIAQLVGGCVPWLQPWGTAAAKAPLAMPKNASTGRCYFGINVLILWGAVTGDAAPRDQPDLMERPFFSPDSVFAFVRWVANEHGAVLSRVTILRAVTPGQPYQTVPSVRPGGEILLAIGGWPKVERALQAINAIEAIGIDPTEVSPDHWRHLNNRLTAGQEPRPYSRLQHRAFLLRRRAAP